MKKIIVLLSLFFVVRSAYSQSKSVDSILQKLSVEKDDDKKVDLAVSLFLTGLDKDPYLTIKTGQSLLEQGLQNNDPIKEASAYCILGTGLRVSGNPIRGLQMQQKGLLFAEKANNFSLLAMVKNQMAHTYRDRDEWENAFKLYSVAMDDAVKGKNEVIKIWPLMNLGVCYLNLNKLDSALKYLQRAYELSITINQWDLPYMLWNLGSVHSKMGNALLAVSYFKMSIQMAEDSKRYRQLNFAYTGLAEHFQRMNQRDSCIFYLKKALTAVQNTPFFFMSVKPAKMLAEFYEKSNCDSTLKWANIYKIANDSVFSNKINQQIQVMTFEEELRQQELTTERTHQEVQHRRNLQYAAFAIGLITFVILFLLLSRSIVVKPKFIEFFGVLALLAVFEFINLFIHPYLAHATNDSPVLMLVVLIAIGALLIPLHHKLEKWITKIMVEKNKKIRLEAAKKTIQQLEG
ncbi:MAG: tetratricopeptide repeat protein [Bacteroidota bacterium]|nr:tetratricopeptide repeat protein [Bacteroidota bacterium]